MAVYICVWIAPFFISLMTSEAGLLGRSLDSVGFQTRLATTGDEATLRADVRIRGTAEAHRERCAKLSAPWLENTQQAPTNDATLLQLRVRPFSPAVSRGLVFPGKSLFNFIRRVYHCCQQGVSCRSVKGIQGRLRGDADVEFVLTREILSLAVMRAELHLQLSNPDHLDFVPVIPFMSKHNLPTRYSLGSLGDMVELKVDLLFLFQSLQEVAAGAGRGPNLVNIRWATLFSNEEEPGQKPSLGVLRDPSSDVWGDGPASTLPALDLGLILGCSQGGLGVPCGTNGVQLSHTPFMVLYYR